MSNVNVTWSAKTLEAFTMCPQRYYRTQVLKDIDMQPTPAAEYSNQFHELLGQALTGTPFPQKFARFQRIVDLVRALPGKHHVFRTLAVNRQLKECSLDKAWVKATVDYMVVNGKEAVLFFWKTGQKAPSDASRLSAALLFCLNHECVAVSIRTFWLRAGCIEKESFTRAELPELLKTFVPAYKRLLDAHQTGAWKSTPCGLCKHYCEVKDCRFNGV